MFLKSTTLALSIVLLSTLALAQGREAVTADTSAQELKNEAAQAAPITYTQDQLYLFDVFNTRRSVRAFKSDPIPQEHVVKMLEIANTAPSAMNQQPWKFLVIQDRVKIDRLRDECVRQSLENAQQRQNMDAEALEKTRQDRERFYTGFLAGPMHVVVLMDKNSRLPNFNIHDCSLAAGYLLLAARALGYGTVYAAGTIPAPVAKKVLEIPDNYEQLCYIPIGVPENWPDPPKKKSFDDLVVFEKLIQGVNYDLPAAQPQDK